jgi:hypothetical protein
MSLKEVFVLGAGFTKAFAADAPLLLDEYDSPEVRQFDAFTYTRAILDEERSRCPRGMLNLERLMTRLAGGMPYDWNTGSKDLLQALLSALKQTFLSKIREAKTNNNVRWIDLQLLAKHCRKNRIHCVTFNYDDFFDQALSDTAINDPYDDITSWHPDWGYGFYCPSSVLAVGASSLVAVTRPRMGMQLLKLHGSVNWRVRHGQPSPYATGALSHFENWVTIPEYENNLDMHNTRLPEVVDPFLDPEPFMVPPVLAKSDLVEQPILRVLWTLACEALEKAEKVTFVGYSLPITDIAAGTLFRETLSHLDVSKVQVVDWATEAEADEKRDQLHRSYREVFRGFTPDRIDLTGGLAWAQSICRNPVG